jgi:hypothetical protein
MKLLEYPNLMKLVTDKLNAKALVLLSITSKSFDKLLGSNRKRFAFTSMTEPQSSEIRWKLGNHEFISDIEITCIGMMNQISLHFHSRD